MTSGLRSNFLLLHFLACCLESFHFSFVSNGMIREEIAIMELELVSHHFHMGLSHFLKNF